MCSFETAKANLNNILREVMDADIEELTQEEYVAVKNFVDFVNQESISSEIDPFEHARQLLAPFWKGNCDAQE